MKNVVVTLLALSALSSVGLPAYANSASIQTSEQTAITTGHGNITTQDSRQSIDTRSPRSGRANSGHVQDARQTSDTLGSGNDTLQQNNQRIRRNAR